MRHFNLSHININNPCFRSYWLKYMNGEALNDKEKRFQEFKVIFEANSSLAYEIFRTCPAEYEQIQEKEFIDDKEKNFIWAKYTGFWF